MSRSKDFRRNYKEAIVFALDYLKIKDKPMIKYHKAIGSYCDYYNKMIVIGSGACFFDVKIEEILFPELVHWKQFENLTLRMDGTKIYFKESFMFDIANKPEFMLKNWNSRHEVQARYVSRKMLKVFQLL